MSDLISRQDAIKTVATVTMSIHLSNVLCERLSALPSADAVQIPIKLEKRYPQSRDEDITDAFMRGYLAGRSSADRPTGECRTCGRNVDNGGAYEDGRTKCPIQEHYALLLDGYCHLYEPYDCGTKMGGDNDVCIRNR